MEKKQGFFSALKEEVVRTLSHARSRNPSPGRFGWSRGKKLHLQGRAAEPEQLIWRSGSLRPVMEGQDPDENGAEDPSRRRANGSGLGRWVKGPPHGDGSSAGEGATAVVLRGSRV